MLQDPEEDQGYRQNIVCQLKQALRQDFRHKKAFPDRLRKDTLNTLSDTSVKLLESTDMDATVWVAISTIRA